MGNDCSSGVTDLDIDCGIGAFSGGAIDPELLAPFEANYPHVVKNQINEGFASNTPGGLAPRHCVSHLYLYLPLSKIYDSYIIHKFSRILISLCRCHL